MNRTILIIDDDFDLLALHKINLEREGYHVFTCQSAEEALRLLGPRPKLDLILLDINMPGVDGPMLLQQLKRQMPDVCEQVPIVFFSSMNMPRNTIAKGIIQKSADFSTFKSELLKYFSSPVAAEVVESV